MKKNIKILFNVLSGILIVSIIVPILLSFILSLNPVQNFILKKVTKYASEHIGSQISIGSIKFSNIYNVELEDIFVKDPKLNDTLLQISHLEAEIAGYNITNSQIVFDRVFLKNGLYTLIQYNDSTNNIKCLINRFSKKTKSEGGGAKLLFNNITLDSITFRLKKEEPKNIEQGINYTNMSLDNISGNVDFLKIDNTTITGRANNLSFKEKDNITAKALSVKDFLISPNKMRYENVKMKFGQSNVDVEYFEMLYKEWDMDDFINRVEMGADIRISNIDMNDVAKFTTKYRGWASKIELSANFRGTVSDFKGEIHHLKALNSTIYGGDYHISGIPIVDSMYFDINIDSIESNSADVYTIVNDFAINESIGFIKELDKQPEFTASGSFKGKLSDININAKFSPTNNIGSGTTNFRITKATKGVNLKGDIKLNQINPNNFYPIKEIEHISAHAEIDGLITPGGTDIKAKAYIDTIYLLKNSYNKISIDGALDSKSFSGIISSRDENISFDFNGQIDISEKKPNYKAYLDIKNIDLYHFNILKYDTILNASAKIMVNGAGTNFKELQITSKINELSIRNSKDTISSKKGIDIDINNSPNINSLKIESEFIDLVLRGRADLQTIENYIKESVTTYLPVLTTDQPIKDSVNVLQKNKNTEPLFINTDDNYVAEINLKQQTKLIDAIIPNLSIAEGTKILFSFNPYKKTYSFNVNSKLISYNENMISNLVVSSMSRGESMSLYMSADELLYSTIYIPKLSIISNIAQDKMSTSIGFTNTINDSKLLFKSTGVISKNSETNSVNIATTILPSYFRLKDKQWNVLSGELIALDNKIQIDSLNINSDEESLLVNGYLSKLATDFLNIELENFNISMISVLTEKIGFSFDGYLNGKANLIAALDKNQMALNGVLSAKNLYVNNAHIPDSKILIEMDKSSMLNKIYLTDNATQAVNARGSLSWVKNEYSFDFLFKKFNPILITPFLKGIGSDIGGSVNVELNLSNINNYKKPILNGSIGIEEFYTTLDYTNVKYSTTGNMRIKDNVFEMSGTKIHDEYSGSGDLDIMLNIHQTDGFLFEINVKPVNMLALNTKQIDNSIFYGNVFVSGELNVNNTKGNGVELTANAKTSNKSKFYLPLSHNSSISDAEFIKFTSKKNKDSLKNILWDKYKSKTKITSFSGLDIKLNLDVLENAEIEIVIDPATGSTINGVGRGEMLLHVNPEENIFTINGDYSISNGTYKFILPTFNIVNKVFNIAEGGWIRFNGDPITESTLNVDAVYKLKASIAPLLVGSGGEQFSQRVDVDCIMNIKNSLLKPDIGFNIDVTNTDPETAAVVRSVLNTPEEVSNQFAFLLLSNSFLATGENTESNVTNIGITTGIEFLTSKIKEFISSDKFDFSLNYMPINRSGYTSDEVSLGISAPLYKDKIFLDVQGNFNFMNNSSAIASPNLNKVSGEFSLTWILNESGNLRLKGFSRPIETFDENQGLQESGIGVYYKEEFDNIEELRQKYRTFFKERERKRAEKKEKRNKN